MGVPSPPRGGSPAGSLGATFITWGLYLSVGNVPVLGYPEDVNTHEGASETREHGQDALSPCRGAKVGTDMQLQPHFPFRGSFRVLL